jgi:hypothetical protein
VGIGTASPAYKLTVDHTSSLGFAVTRSAKYIGINANAAGSNLYSYIETDTGMALAFNTNGSNERMRITSAGDVIVGGGSTSYGPLTSTGSIAPAATPSTSWGIDFGSASSPPNYITLTAAATYDLAVGSGIVVVHNNSTGDAGIFLTYGGTVTKLGGAASIVSGTGGASQIGLIYNGGAGKYRINNGYATTQAVFVTTIKTRATS